jgi:agmatinase
VSGSRTAYRRTARTARPRSFRLSRSDHVSSSGHASEETPLTGEQPGNVGPVDATEVPRFAGLATFARLPSIGQVDRCDVAVAGVPFDAGTTFRAGARFGPASVRQISRLLRTYDPALDVEPFAVQQVADAGDLVGTPFDIAAAIEQIESGADDLLGRATHLMAIGGDHTISLPLLRAVNRRFGRVALVHFDAHLDTWDTYFGAPYTHGTPFRRAFEEELLAGEASIHVGVRSSTYAKSDYEEDASFGFRVISAPDLETIGVAGAVERIRARVGDAPVYVSIDVDVLDPAHAPGTGTPEAGGLTSRELLGILTGMAGLRIVSADVVEVAPAYDHAEITSIAAAHLAYTLLGMMPTARR